METITFYSYKGGVGRTLALANIAMYLRRFGLNVCLLDFDLEAPGLHYKFIQNPKPDDIKSGLLDYIYEFTQEKNMPKDFVPFSIEIAPKTERYGSIRLIPAGNVLSAGYWKKLASIDWHDMFYREDSEGVPFFLELKERIEIEFKPDFLLIDSRTGVTEMGGVCTALLPDKVVFLIANNQENIDGARQIIKGIKKVDRLPGQKPIEVILELTRIPSSYDKREYSIVANVLNILSEDIDETENKLSAQDICILHSDRELELSESLRFGKGKTDIETSLTYDYLKLFLKIIPKDIMLPRIDSILDSLVSANMMFDNPDQVQSGLEELSLALRHPKVLEKLIEFYILRKVETEKILNKFDELWKIFGIDNPKILSKYISLFWEWDFNSPRIPNFDIVIEGIDLDPSVRSFIEIILLKAYKKYAKNPRELFQYYCNFIDKDKDKIKVLNLVIDDIIEDNPTIALSLIDKYGDIVSCDVDLRIKRVKVNFIIGESEELPKLLNEEWVSTRDFLDREPNLFFSVMEVIGKEQIANSFLNKYLEKSLQEEDYDELYGVFTIYYKLDRKDELQDKIAKNNKSESSVVQKVLEELDINSGTEDDIPF